MLLDRNDRAHHVIGVDLDEVPGLGSVDAHEQLTGRSRVVDIAHPTSDEDTPTNLVAGFKYSGKELFATFETRDGYTNEEAGMGTEYPFVDHRNVVGVIFFGTEGYMIFSRRGAFSVFLGPKGTPGPTEGKELRGKTGYADHMTNFLNAVRERTPTNAPPEIAHYSCALVHLGEITHLTTGRLDFDPAAEKFTAHPQANDLLTKPYRPPYTLPTV